MSYTYTHICIQEIWATEKYKHVLNNFLIIIHNWTHPEEPSSGMVNMTLHGNKSNNRNC